MVKQSEISDLFKDLNQEQRAAVTHKEGPLLIVAGAGTGKTTVITKRIAWLIEQGLAKPNEILALTFTDKAAGEMEERVDRLLPLGYVNLWISTFHSFAERVLKDWSLDIGIPGDFKLLTATEQWLLVKQNLDKFDLDYYRPLGNPTKFVHALLKHFSRAKDEEVYPEDYLKLAESKKLDAGLGEYTNKNKSKNKEESDEIEEGEIKRLEEVAKAYHVYQKLLLDNNALDFGDLINYCLKLFRERPQILKHFREQFKYILVDEFQDTNYAQYELIKIVAAPQNNITVVGDDDQSIFKFRGASISNILEFKKDYPKTREILLTTNYRSTQNILDLSYKFIQQNNPYRLEMKLSHGLKKLSKKLKAVGDNKSDQIELLIFSNVHQEALGVINKIIELKNKDNQTSWNDFAILVRANSSAEPFLQNLRKASIPFEYVASRGLYQEAIILDLVAYFKLLDNYHESQALYRVLTTPWFKLPNDDLSSLLYFANRKSLSLYEALSQSQTIPVSAEAQKIVDSLLSFITKHSDFAREKTASETYLRVIRDIGITDWLVQNQDNYEVIKQANFLTAWFKKIQEFELNNSDKSLNNFLKIFTLEQEAGEEGELPPSWEEGPEMVKVITVHSAKGLEFKYVFIVQLVDRRFPSTERREAITLPTELVKEILSEGDIHLQEERRLFYVAMTRAKCGLYFSYAFDYFGKQKRKPSQFLYELGLVPKEAVEEKTLKEELILNKKEETVKRKVTYLIPEQFSFSSISSYLKCPLEFKYRYLLKIPTPGNAYLSFGSSIHKTLENFMKLWKSQLSSEQLDLFVQGGKIKNRARLPTFKELEKIYQESWLDDWYESKRERDDFKKRGLEQIKIFYETTKSNPPQPKYVEQFFKIKFGDYKFVGKIDRMDAVAGGVNIIDYKTGDNPPKNLAKVDKDQLLIYQLAAQEFLQEKVINCQYWYLNKNVWSDPFLGAREELADLRDRYIKVIEQIIESIRLDNFAAIHKDGGHDCQYKFLT